MGLQFHPEVTPQIMEEWVRVYPHELEAEGVDPESLLDETRRRAAEARRVTWRLFDRFRDAVARRGRCAPAELPRPRRASFRAFSIWRIQTSSAAMACAV